MRTLIRRICIVIALILCFISAGRLIVKAEDPLLMQPALQNIDCSAASMAMVEKDSGRLIMEKNAFVRRPMASTTKIMTAITAIKNCNDIDKKVKIPREAVGVEGSSIYLRQGEELSIRDLLYGLMLRSGNDSAVAIAIAVGGSVERFADMMNRLAAEIGACDSHFVNPHGLHDENHFTTAYDLARISAYAMDDETFREIVSTKVYKAPDGEEGGRVMVNKNKLLSSLDGCDGIKTGYTVKAGRCLVSSATRNGKTLVCVVLNCGPMFEECARLTNYAFDSLIMSDVISTQTPIKQVKVKGGKQNYVGVGIESIVNFPLSVDEVKDLRFEFDLPDEIKAPVKKGERIGKIDIYLHNRLLFSEDLFTMDSVGKESFLDLF